MIGAAIVFSLLYYVVVEKTGVAASATEVIFTNVSDAEFVQIDIISQDGIILTPTPKRNSVVYCCLVTKDFFDKMTGYSMEVKHFLMLGGKEAAEDRIEIHKTTALSVMNYFNAPSENLMKGKSYFLIVGEKDAEGEFTNTNANCIKIQL